MLLNGELFYTSLFWELVAFSLDLVGVKYEQIVKPVILEEFFHGTLWVLVGNFWEDREILVFALLIIWELLAFLFLFWIQIYRLNVLNLIEDLQIAGIEAVLLFNSVLPKKGVIFLDKWFDLAEDSSAKSHIALGELTRHTVTLWFTASASNFAKRHLLQLYFLMNRLWGSKKSLW